MIDASPPSDELLTSFWAYEHDLISNHVTALANWFLDSATAIRSDPTALLSGRGDIAEFRRLRPPPGVRTVERLHHRRISADAAALIAETRTPSGTGSTQLQLWQLTVDGWRIAVAQVMPTPAAPVPTPIPAADRTVWREHGTPLLPSTADGSLSGTRIAVKDLFALPGHRVGAGNPDWLADAPVETNAATAVDDLLNAGAEVAGITQTDELAFALAGANAHYGTPPNPRAPGRIPGGSTSGSAAAVASGAAEIGLGTDTAGSIRVPASYCGLYGLRTTHGVVSRAGLTGLASSFDTVGFLTREVATLRAVARAARLPEPAQPVRTLLVVSEFVGLADLEVQESFQAAVLALSGRKRLPVRVIASLSDGALDTWLEAFRTMQAIEAWQLHADWLKTHPTSLGPAVQARFDIGAAVTPAQREAVESIAAEARARIIEAVPPGTALLLPATSGPAPVRDLDPAAMEAVRTATLKLTFLASVSGLPAISAPLLARGPLPVGLSAIGASGTDADLIELVAP
ncbi:Asp-tRNAAsn/Glu-tRNAGln amidotransferase A subunit family amidase [Jatrophihabitans sp. GAS493]|uniref:AtzH-like domain-containing protein n=1 Tax=Jatrophihabitans sp. GAS493 TaxID=1907575 RepID=UPI000BC06913|nr:AtzH-like domain-containing protein [Jatrophihabitans sp. GAS493]SOD74687.1 Asp-tRNAAsn/Glu-tRNAGln amidotransferase A subunit family amidase [Jatrophihabitans sp. GAS493]